MAVVRMEGAQAQVLESLRGGAWQERNTLGGGEGSECGHEALRF